MAQIQFSLIIKKGWTSGTLAYPPTPAHSPTSDNISFLPDVYHPIYKNEFWKPLMKRNYMVLTIWSSYLCVYILETR